jgi:hypothetical protein
LPRNLDLHVTDQGGRCESNGVALAEAMPTEVQQAMAAGEGEHLVIVYPRQYLDVAHSRIGRLDRQPDELVKHLRAGHDRPRVG